MKPGKYLTKTMNDVKLKSLNITLCLLMEAYNATYSQNMVISAGTKIEMDGGLEVIQSNIVNNGSFINNNNLIILNGSVQSLGGSFPVAFADLKLETGSTVTINTPGQTLSGSLLCNGILNANGNIILLSSGAGTALIDGSGTGEVLGNLTMQRYLPSSFGYKYFSSPFQAATVNEFSDNIDLADPSTSFYRYDENRNISGIPASGWVSYKIASNPLEPMAGYAVNFGSSNDPATVDIKGVVNNGSLSRTLYNHNNIYTEGFNLTGNPYPSPIDWNATSGWTKINIDDGLYYFKASETDQYGGTYSTFLNGISSDGLATNIIPSMQGFFVHVTDGAFPVTATLGFDNSVRVNDRIHPFIKKSEGSSSPAYVRIAAGYSDDSLSFDPLVIYYFDGATYNFDSQYDALKLFNTDANVTNFYSFGEDGSRLSINALPIPDSDTTTIRLGLKTMKDGPVKFKIKFISEDFNYDKIVLTDRVTGTSSDLITGDQYLVSLPAGDYQDRFFLNLSNKIITSIRM